MIKAVHISRTLLLLAMFAISTLLASHSAHADVTCSASMTSLNFGNVNPLDGSVDATAQLTYTCHNNWRLGNTHVKICFGIDAGVQGTGHYNPRQMGGTNPGNVLAFQLYQDGSKSLIWGTSGSPNPTPMEIAFDIGANSNKAGSITLYGSIPSGQTSVPADSYSNSFSGANTKMSIASTDDFLWFQSPPPATCGTDNQGTFPFTVLATGVKDCTISATDMDFGTPVGFLSANIDTTSALQVRCTNTTAWKIGLDNGQHASGNTRRMHGPGGYVSYDLYQNGARTVRWGNTPGTDTENGSGTGATQSLTVYGRVPPQSTPSAGNYNDVITVTVTY